MFQGIYPSEPSPRRRYVLVAELAVPRDPHLHFTTFENSVFVQKRTFENYLDKCLVSKAALSIMAQSCLWSSQIAAKKIDCWC